MFEIEGDSSTGNVNSELPAELDDLFDDRASTSATDPPTGNGSQTSLDAPSQGMPPHSQPHGLPPHSQPLQQPQHSQPPPHSHPHPPYRPGPYSEGPAYSSHTNSHNSSVSVTSAPLHPPGYPPVSAGAPYHPATPQHHPGPPLQQNNSVLQGLLRNNSNSTPEMNGPRSVGGPSPNAAPSPQRAPPPFVGRSPHNIGGMGSPPPSSAPPPPASRHHSGPGGRPPDQGPPTGFPVSSMGPVSYSQPPSSAYANSSIVSSATPPISGMQPRMMGPGPQAMMRGQGGPRGGAPVGPRGPMSMQMPDQMQSMPPNRMPPNRLQQPMGYGPPPGDGAMGYSNGMSQPMRHAPPEYLQAGQGGPMQPNVYRAMAPQPPYQNNMNMGAGMSGPGGGMGMEASSGGGGPGVSGAHFDSGAGQGMSMPPSSGAGPTQAGAPGPGPPGQGPGAPGGAQGGQQQDPEKRKLIQQQLVLLLHAHKCQQRERDVPNGQRQECTLPHCSTMKGVLSHMTNCGKGRSCTYAHCASSRQIIQHWKNCNRSDCPVCLPLKAIASDGSGRSNADSSMLNIISGGQGSGGQPTPGLGPPQPAGPAPSNAPGPEPAPLLNGRGPNGPGGPLAAFPGPAGNGPPPPNAVIGPAQATHVPRPPNAPPPGGPIANQLPPPENADTVKSWHRQVTADLRNHLVGKLVKAIFPSPDPSAIHDQRIRDLIQYARKVEKDMFEFANDREEYYHLLAEKIYKIQKELQDKKAKREQIQRSGMPNSGISSNMLKDMDMTAPPNRVAPGDVGAGSGGPGAPNGALGGTPFPGLGLPPAPASHPHGQLSLGPTPPYPKTELDLKPDLNAIRDDIASAHKSMKLEGEVKKEELEDEGGKGGSGNVPTTPAAPRVVKPKSPPPPTQSAAAVKDKEFPPNQLRTYLMSVWEKLENMDEAIPFRVPVDPDLLQIPDYFDIIKHPMDLSTIKEKINNGEYSNPWAFCDDIWLMFENAWVYNKKNSKVYKYCTKMSEWFVTLMDPVMRELGFCCSRRMSFTPLPIFCYGKPMCAIPRDHEYYSYNASSSQFGVTVSEQYQYCLKCFDALPDVINLGDDPSSNKMVSKTEFKRCKNDQVEHEPFVHCQYCGRKWHNICALYHEKVNQGGFSCASCLLERKQTRPEVKTTAKRLPHCKLSQHIEKRVMRYLEERVKEGGMARKDLHEVHIRVLASADKEVELKPLMKAMFAQPNSVPKLPEKSPYRTKAVFAFQNINGNEVCFFGLYVQEYGTNSARCNQRRVYIAYLDSVHYYEPRSERTNVYHQILLGYLEYVKTLGFTIAHLWACPPSEGDDYIFHCHPPEQKIPRQNRLKEWYKKMLDKGVVDRIVMDYRDILRDAQQDCISTPADLPYFEGDFWPSVFEDCIREYNKEEDERRRQEEQEVDDGEGPDGPDGPGPSTDKASGKSKKGKGQKRKGAHSKKGNPKKSKKGVTGNELMDKVLVHMEKHKDVFFVIRLISIQQASVLKAIEDPDSLVNSDLMDVRDNFLNRAREEHWEFSSKRRATYSTMCLTHALHTQGRELESYECNNCKSTLSAPNMMHCTVCEDFDLCSTCYGKISHEHRMKKMESLVGDGGENGPEKSDQNNRSESIQRCIQSLVHACQCRDANCRRLSCHKMKRVVQHTKMCKKRQSGHCPVCKQLIALCCYHAKHCVEAQCQVPFCMNIRLKLEEQRKAQRRQQDRMMQRRMQGMYQMNQMQMQPPTPGQASTAPSPAGSIAHSNSVGHALSSQASPMPHSLSMSSFSSQQQSPLMGGDTTAGAMEAARTAQRIANLQQQGGQRASMGPGPGPPAPGQPPPGAPRLGQQASAPPGATYARTLPMHPAPPAPGQPQMSRPQMQMSMESQRTAMAGMMVGQQNQQGPPGRGRGGPGPGGQGGRQPMDPKVVAILSKLKTARDPEEHSQILLELQKDPQLMASFIAMKNNLPQSIGQGGQGGMGRGMSGGGGPAQGQGGGGYAGRGGAGYPYGSQGAPPLQRGGAYPGASSFPGGPSSFPSAHPQGPAPPPGPFGAVRSPQANLRSPSAASPALHQQPGSIPPSLDPPAATDFR